MNSERAGRARVVRDAAAAVLWQAAIITVLPYSYRLYTWARPAIKPMLGGLLLAAVVALGALAWRRLRARRAGSPAEVLLWLYYPALLAGLAIVLHYVPETIRRIHLMQYLVLALLVYRALRHAWRDAGVLAVALVVCMLGALLDESVQGLLSSRIGDIADVRVNLAGILLGLAAAGGPDARRRGAAPRRATLRRALQAGVMLCLLLAAFTTWNPDRPFGHRHVVAGLGTFYSVWTLPELQREDVRLAGIHPQELAHWREERDQGYLRAMRARFQRASDDPQVVDFCVDLYRRVLLRNRLMEDFRPQEAWMENRGGDRLSGGLPSATPIPWDATVQRVGWVSPTEGALTTVGKTHPTAMHGRAPVPPWSFDHAPADATAASPLLAAASSAYLRAVHGSFEDVLKSWYLDDASPEPLLRELRWHLFRRYHGAIVGDYTVVWGENAILERFFPATLACTGMAWPPETKARVLAAFPGLDRKPYTTIVGKDYIYQISPMSLWTLCLLGAGACLWGARRLKRGATPAIAER